MHALTDLYTVCMMLCYCMCRPSIQQAVLMNQSKFIIFYFHAFIAHILTSISSADYIKRMNIKAQLYIVRFRRTAATGTVDVYVVFLKPS